MSTYIEWLVTQDAPGRRTACQVDLGKLMVKVDSLNRCKQCEYIKTIMGVFTPLIPRDYCPFPASQILPWISSDNLCNLLQFVWSDQHVNLTDQLVQEPQRLQEFLAQALSLIKEQAADQDDCNTHLNSPAFAELQAGLQKLNAHDQVLLQQTPGKDANVFKNNCGDADLESMRRPLANMDPSASPSGSSSVSSVTSPSFAPSVNWANLHLTQTPGSTGSGSSSLSFDASPNMNGPSAKSAVAPGVLASGISAVNTSVGKPVVRDNLSFLGLSNVREAATTPDSAFGTPLANQVARLNLASELSPLMDKSATPPPAAVQSPNFNHVPGRPQPLLLQVNGGTLGPAGNRPGAAAASSSATPCDQVAVPPAVTQALLPQDLLASLGILSPNFPAHNDMHVNAPSGNAQSNSRLQAFFSPTAQQQLNCTAFSIMEGPMHGQMQQQARLQPMMSSPAVLEGGQKLDSPLVSARSERTSGALTTRGEHQSVFEAEAVRRAAAANAQLEAGDSHTLALSQQQDRQKLQASQTQLLATARHMVEAAAKKLLHMLLVQTWESVVVSYHTTHIRLDFAGWLMGTFPTLDLSAKIMLPGANGAEPQQKLLEVLASDVATAHANTEVVQQQNLQLSRQLAVRNQRLLELEAEVQQLRQQNLGEVNLLTGLQEQIQNLGNHLGSCLARQRTAADMQQFVRLATLPSKLDRMPSDTDMLCPVCWEAKRNLVFQCGHQTCQRCGSRLAACPICRQHITQRIITY